jgi:excisionase family DNA binding protein
VLETPRGLAETYREVTTMSAYATPLRQTTESVALAPMLGLTRDDVMTAREVAELLKMPVSTIYQLARRGELPASRLGRTWRFLRPRLEVLLAS